MRAGAGCLPRLRPQPVTAPPIAIAAHRGGLASSRHHPANAALRRVSKVGGRLARGLPLDQLGLRIASGAAQLSPSDKSLIESNSNFQPPSVWISPAIYSPYVVFRGITYGA
jgi:hypothetical protein